MNTCFSQRGRWGGGTFSCHKNLIVYDISLLTFSFPVPRSTGANTNLASSSNISKTVRVNIAFVKVLLRVVDKLSNDRQVDKSCTCGSQLIDV